MGSLGVTGWNVAQNPTQNDTHRLRMAITIGRKDLEATLNFSMWAIITSFPSLSRKRNIF
ncbi:MAG TPA: hypothetical protein VLR89_08235 [Anaerolineaceae bacterium]|nr:hypothetical protein [Anaerolineaceae bacterium]